VGTFGRKLVAVQLQPGQDRRSDAELVRAVNDGGAGAARAFEAIYRRHRDWVVNTAYRFTRDRDAALDVMQDVFVYLLGKFPGFVLTARLTTFLYPAIKHTALQLRRKADRFGGSDEALPDLPAPQASSQGGDGTIQRVLADLPAPQREVLLLRFVDGMTLGEIALALGVPAGTVKSRIHHAIRTLRADPDTKKYFED
jgi:RNA polymerase sigma-70 factor, ECF subfamily